MAQREWEWDFTKEPSEWQKYNESLKVFFHVLKGYIQAEQVVLPPDLQNVWNALDKQFAKAMDEIAVK
jgi:hypothetical protein